MRNKWSTNQHSSYKAPEAVQSDFYRPCTPHHAGIVSPGPSSSLFETIVCCIVGTGARARLDQGRRYIHIPSVCLSVSLSLLLSLFLPLYLTVCLSFPPYLSLSLDPSLSLSLSIFLVFSQNLSATNKLIH